MKTIIFSTMLLAFSISHAEVVSPTITISTPTSSSATQTSSSDNSGVNNNTTFTSPSTITQHIDYSGTQTIKNTPSVNGPPLTTSNDTCMGSTSGSINVAGLGLGGGSTYVDENCKRLKNSRELWNMGMKAASLSLMCNDSDNLVALELTGYICPQTLRNNTLKVSPSIKFEYTDPIVRRRLGLPAL